MLQKTFLIFILVLSLLSCSKKDIEYEPKDKVNPYTLYQEGFELFERGIIFTQKKNLLKLN